MITAGVISVTNKKWTFYDVLIDTINNADKTSSTNSDRSITKANLALDHNINSIGREIGMFDKLAKDTTPHSKPSNPEDLLELYYSDIKDLSQDDLELYL